MRVVPIVASRLLSDGGTCFGVVPRAIWSRYAAPDARNRIPHHANCLLIEYEPESWVLVDTGCGDPNRFESRFLRNHGMDDSWPLMDNLARFGIRPEKIRRIILSHLHWDHAGGVCVMGKDGGLEPAFPNAEYYVHELEWEDATSGRPEFYKAYPSDLIDAICHVTNGRLHMVTSDSSEIIPGVNVQRSGGHTRGHMMTRISLARTHLEGWKSDKPMPPYLLYAGDVCAASYHLRMVFQFSADAYPLETRRWKHDQLLKIAREGGLLMFAHDPNLFAATIRPDVKKEFVVERTWMTELVTQFQSV